MVLIVMREHKDTEQYKEELGKYDGGKWGNRKYYISYT